MPAAAGARDLFEGARSRCEAQVPKRRCQRPIRRCRPRGPVAGSPVAGARGGVLPRGMPETCSRGLAPWPRGRDLFEGAGVTSAGDLLGDGAFGRHSEEVSGTSYGAAPPMGHLLWGTCARLPPREAGGGLGISSDRDHGLNSCSRVTFAFCILISDTSVGLYAAAPSPGNRKG